MSYDADKLRTNLDAALAEFMKDTNLMPGTRGEVVAYVTEVALIALRHWCGDPTTTERPIGIMGYPIRVHEPCADPTCVLCTGKFDIVFGKPRRFSS